VRYAPVTKTPERVSSHAPEGRGEYMHYNLDIRVLNRVDFLSLVFMEYSGVSYQL